MASIQVVTDSACDLTAATTDEHDVRVVPLTIRFGPRSSSTARSCRSRSSGTASSPDPTCRPPRRPSPGAFRQAFLDAADAGRDGVVCVTLSSGLSATYQAACTAAEAVAEAASPVRVVDTQRVTMGQGLLALAAADMAGTAPPSTTIAAALEAMQRPHPRLRRARTASTTSRRGGRIGGAAHLVGSLLSIKPVIEVRDGVVEVESKQRTRSRSLQYLADKALEAGPLERLAVANGVAPDFDEVLELLRRRPVPSTSWWSATSARWSAATPGRARSGVCFITKPHAEAPSGRIARRRRLISPAMDDQATGHADRVAGDAGGRLAAARWSTPSRASSPPSRTASSAPSSSRPGPSSSGSSSPPWRWC